MIQHQGKFRGGTSGLKLLEPNKHHFPPAFKEKSRLSYYASTFNSIEINSSFYSIPRCQTYSRWSADVPEDFQFSVKLWKGITHDMKSSLPMHDFEAFFSAVDCLGKRKGCLLIQFPAGMPKDLDRVRKILENVKKLDPVGLWRIAVEFRHNHWYEKSVFDMIDEFNASLVLQDMPNSRMNELNGKPGFVYLRFHGEKGDYRGTYSTDFLQARARDIKCWLNCGLDVYVYFNNTIGAAVANLKTLNELVSVV
jgi:uncharacterized protein YecE (DUF72 family)